MKLIILVGISGSGKTTYKNKLLKENDDYVDVCPDDVRKNLTGNISDQSKNNEVFEKSYSDIKKYLKDGKTVIFDATNLNYRQKLLKIANELNSPFEFHVLKDSFDKDLCKSRVDKDLKTGIDRANTLSDEAIIDNQYTNFINTIEIIKHYSHTFYV